MERNNFLKLKPMLLSEEFKPFDDKNFIYELKLKNSEIMVNHVGYHFSSIPNIINTDRNY